MGVSFSGNLTERAKVVIDDRLIRKGVGVVVPEIKKVKESFFGFFVPENIQNNPVKGLQIHTIRRVCSFLYCKKALLTTPILIV